MNISIVLLIIAVVLLFIIKPSHFFTVYHYDEKERLGKDNDGGYVIAKLKGDYDLYLSCGIGGDISFDEAFCSKFPQVNGFAFDATIQNIPKLPEKMSYVSKNIDSKNTDKTTDLVSYMEGKNDIFMKMDIEGGEWEWLKSVNDRDLSKIKQLVIEIHWLFDDKSAPGKEKKKSLERLSKFFYLVHVHGTNCISEYNDDGVPYIMECTYVRKTEIPPPKLNKTAFPTNLDSPCNPNMKELSITAKPFVH
jgi:hypothetical protein